jgi:hypothetical protein
VLRHVVSVRITGNGRHIVTTRYLNERASIWFGDPDGTLQRRLLTRSESGHGTSFDEVTPRYDGRQLLAYRTSPTDDGGPDVSDVVTWKTSESPASAIVIERAGSNSTITWN